MYYKVVEEKCYNGIKERFTVGQIINDNEVSEVKKEFDENFRDIFEDRKRIKFEFYRLGIFNDREDLYRLILDKNSF